MTKPRAEDFPIGCTVRVVTPVENDEKFTTDGHVFSVVGHSTDDDLLRQCESRGWHPCVGKLRNGQWFASTDEGVFRCHGATPVEALRAAMKQQGWSA